MIAHLDRADRLIATLTTILQNYRGPLNHSRTLTVTVDMDGQRLRLPILAGMDEPTAENNLDEIERNIVQTLAESTEPLTIEKLEEKSGHDRSSFYGKAQRIPRLVTEGIIVNVRGRGFKLTAFGKDVADSVAD